MYLDLYAAFPDPKVSHGLPPLYRHTHTLLVSARKNPSNEVLYLGLPFKRSLKLQLVQNAIPKYQHVTSVLKVLHWLLVVFKGQFKGLGITYKDLYGLGSQGLPYTTDV